MNTKHISLYLYGVLHGGLQLISERLRLGLDLGVRLAKLLCRLLDVGARLLEGLLRLAASVGHLKLNSNVISSFNIVLTVEEEATTSEMDGRDIKEQVGVNWVQVANDSEEWRNRGGYVG